MRSSGFFLYNFMQAPRIDGKRAFFAKNVRAYTELCALQWDETFHGLRTPSPPSHGRPSPPSSRFSPVFSESLPPFIHSQQSEEGGGTSVRSAPSPFCAGSPLRTPAYVLPDQSQSSTTSRAEAGLTVLRSIRSTSASMREMLTVMLGITAISPPCSATFTP